MIKEPLFCILASAVIALGLNYVETCTKNTATVTGPIKEVPKEGFVPQNLKIYDDKNILTGKLNSKKIYEDGYVLCFEDIAKNLTIHWLVIPKGGYTDFSDFTDNVPSQEIAVFFSSIAGILKNYGLDERDYKLIMNMGKDFGQKLVSSLYK
jgi:histidine triad (HIT) family protein